MRASDAMRHAAMVLNQAAPNHKDTRQLTSSDLKALGDRYDHNKTLLTAAKDND